MAARGSAIDAREAARRLLRKHGVATAPVPVDAVIKAEGIAIRYSPLADDLSGMAFIKDGQAVIVVNASHHPHRQRFTLAHECGHHVLHAKQLAAGVHVDKVVLHASQLAAGVDVNKVVLHRDALAGSGSDQDEIAANRFASELLMPEFLIAPLRSGLSDMNDEARLLRSAKQFKVSLAALQYRLAASA